MRVALWSPRAKSGWLATLAPHLDREVDLVPVGAEPPAPPAVDLDLYHVDDDPAYAYVYRALLRRSGVVLLEEWGLHRLVHAATLGDGDETGYRREARRSHGEVGTFVARQVARGLGGALPGALLSMNERVLEAGQAFVAASVAVHARLRARSLSQPTLHLPLAFQTPPPSLDRLEARSTLGLSPEGSLITAVLPPGTDSAPADVAQVLGQLGAARPHVTVRWVREDEDGVAASLAAADVVVAVEHPPRTGLGRAVPLAVAAGKAVLVTAGSGQAREMPDGVVAHVSPGPTQAAEIQALVQRLVDDQGLRERMGRLAQTYAVERRDPEGAARALLDLLRTTRRPAPETHAARGGPVVGLAAQAREEILVATRELGLADGPSDLASLTARLFGEDDR